MALAVLALAIQSFIVQTHVHIHNDALTGTQLVNAVANVAAATKPIASKSEPRGHDDSGGCPLCQAFAHFASALVPSPPATMLPVTAAFESSAPKPTIVLGQAEAHDWQSRAPPRA